MGPVAPVLAVECVAKQFGGRKVLSSASLRAYAGQVTALMGRNGTGKSTLLRLAVGDLELDGGTVLYLGKGLLRPRLWRLARQGLFHLPDRVLFSSAYSIRRQLEFLRRRFGSGDVARAIETTDIAQVVDRRPASLSTGELRRAEVAAILVRRPTCLLADEPFRGIMPKDAEFLAGVLRSIAESGAAVVVTGHEVPQLLAMADSVTWCTSGTTYELGPPALAVEHRRFRGEYLGMGYRA